MAKAGMGTGAREGCRLGSPAQPRSEWRVVSCFLFRAKLDTGPDAPFLPEKDDSSGQTDIDLFRYYSTSYLSAMIEN